MTACGEHCGYCGRCSSAWERPGPTDTREWGQKTVARMPHEKPQPAKAEPKTAPKRTA